MSAVRIAAVLACLAAAWIALDWYRSRDAVLSVAPERRAWEISLEPRRSSVTANLALPYPVLEGALNQLAPALSGTQQGSRRIAKVLGRDVEARWDIDHQVDGRLRVRQRGDKLELSLPGRFSGTVGLSGDLARALDLDAKRVEGSFVATASAGVEIGEDFCPKIVPGNVSLAWTREARVEIVGRTRVLGATFGPYSYAFGEDVEEPVMKALRKALAEQRDAIPCGPVRKALGDLWTVQTFPLEIDDMPDLVVQLVPTSLSASDLLVEKAGLRMVARLGFEALVSDRTGPVEAPGDLPKNGGVGAERGRIDLAVPLALSYPAIRETTLSALGDGPLVIETEAGPIAVDDLDVEIYPSGDRIAVGVDFSADLPRRLFDAAGTLWLTARPVVAETGDGVAFEEIGVTRQTDSALWNVLSAALVDRLRAELERQARIDLSGQRQQAITAINDAIVQAGADGGLELTLSDPDLRIDTIRIAAGRLVVVALYSAGLDASVVAVDY